MGNEANGGKQLRLMIENFLTDEECKELEFIHKSCSAVGYRPNVFSTTLFHLVATNSAHLIMPLVPIRERLKEKAEEFFGCEYELFVEFTGLVSWTRGASIGWHSDDNMPYLKQRDFAAVCYLNSYGVDFKGGLFHFQDGEPTTVTPSCGDCMMYSADCRNVHSVDEITYGERLTLTLWFTRDSSHDEDAKLVSLLSKSVLPDHFPCSYLPKRASDNMYWFSREQDPKFESGFDVCWARLHSLGYDVYFPRDVSCADYTSLLIHEVQLVWGNEFFNQEFNSILHALQVVQFHCWKTSKLECIKGDSSLAVPLSPIGILKVRDWKSKLSKEVRLARSIFCHGSYDGKGRQHWLSWDSIAAAAAAWEDYARNLRKQIMSCLPHWTANQSIYTVSIYS